MAGVIDGWGYGSDDRQTGLADWTDWLGVWVRWHVSWKGDRQREEGRKQAAHGVISLSLSLYCVYSDYNICMYISASAAILSQNIHESIPPSYIDETTIFPLHVRPPIKLTTKQSSRERERESLTFTDSWFPIPFPFWKEISIITLSSISFISIYSTVSLRPTPTSNYSIPISSTIIIVLYNSSSIHFLFLFPRTQKLQLYYFVSLSL